MKRRCQHPPDRRHWRDTGDRRYRPGLVCVHLRDFKRARTWHCGVCDEQLPYGEALGDYAEQLAFAFLRGEFRHVAGGFPTVAFHDGYRVYDERILSWIENSPRLDGPKLSAEKIQEWLDDYAAGAFAYDLEQQELHERNAQSQATAENKRRTRMKRRRR